MSVAKIIPFNFDENEVRTLLEDDQLWFVALDVCSALAIRNSRDAMARLDDDEKGVASIDTLGGGQSAGTINESGLYSLILTSRKAEAKRFKKWVTAEVLPAIRKQGRYEDHRNQMGELVLEVIGVSELTAIKGVIHDKAKSVPQQRRLSVIQTLHSRLRTRFNVARTELIPSKHFADACNFIAAYTLEGEWLAKEVRPKDGCHMPSEDLYRVWVLSHHFSQLHHLFREHRMYDALRMLGSPIGVSMIDHFSDGQVQANMLRRNYATQMDSYQRKNGMNHHRPQAELVIN